MKILVYAVGIHRDGGPSGHLRGFLKTLGAKRTAHTWRFILHPNFDVPGDLPAEVEVKYLDPRSNSRRLIQDMWGQRRSAEESDADIMLNLIDFGPLPKTMPVVSFQRNPNYYDNGLLRLRHGRDRAEWLARTQLAHHIVRCSDRVLCPSNTMAEMVRSAVNVPADRIRSYYHPFEHARITTEWLPELPKRVLYTGHLMPHKNHVWLLRVFAESGLAQAGYELWMTASREGWPEGFDRLIDLANQAGISSAVRLLGRVPPDEVHKLYCSSELFVFASAGESFGFPMVEALASGVPSLAYDTPIAREILGSAASFLSHETGEAAAELRRVALLGIDERRALSRRALARAEEVCVNWSDWVSGLEGELESVRASWEARGGVRRVRASKLRPHRFT